MMKCEDIQSVLLDYMTHELGEPQSILVREHLRKCRNCQVAAAEIEAALDLLRQASESERQAPMRLSDERRTRLAWAFTHPVMEWIVTHHILVSFAVALLAILIALLALRKLAIWKIEDWQSVRVTIGTGRRGGATNQPPGETDERGN